MDTQTPRTDAEQKWTFGDNRLDMSFECVKVEFAEKLEKELAEAKRLLGTRVEAVRLDDAERRFQYQKEENDKRIVQIRKLQGEVFEYKKQYLAIADATLPVSDGYEDIIKEIRRLRCAEADAAKMLGMATDLNMLLQNKADMWRDEFQRIKALCHGKSLDFLEIEGVCDRAAQDIRSQIPLIDQREKASDMIAKLNDEAAEVEKLLRIYGWKEEESLQMFLYRTRQSADTLSNSPQYLCGLLQECEDKLAKSQDELARLRDGIDSAKRALDAALVDAETV